MKITHLETLGFDRLADRELTMGPAQGGSMTIVSGGPGTGKTALLELIIAAKEQWAPSGARLPWVPHSSDDIGAKLIMKWAMAGQEVEVEALFDSEAGLGERPSDAFIDCIQGYSLQPSLWKIEYFHDGRRLELARSLQPIRSSKRLDRSDQKYSVLLPLLMELVEQPDCAPRAATLNAALAPFSMEIAAESRQGVVVRTPRGEHQPLDLSHAQQQVLLLLGTATVLGLDNALILIDTIEHGLDRAWAPRIVDALAHVAPYAQIIATTRMPELFGHAGHHIELR